MAKGPSPQTPRPERPDLPPESIPWREPQIPDSPGLSPCAQPKDATVEVLEPVATERLVVAVPAGGEVRLVADGTVFAVLDRVLGDELVTCMADGWRYAGRLLPLDQHRARVTLEARRVL